MAKKPPFKEHLIFKSGIHVNEGDKVWPAEKVKALYFSSMERSPDLIPYVFSHPSSGYPILGHAKKSSMRLEEKDGQAMIYITPDSFAEEMIPALKEVKHTKPSIWLPPVAQGEEKYIGNVGFVAKPGVKTMGDAFGACETCEIAGQSEVVEFSEADLANPVGTMFGSGLRWAIGWRFRNLADWLQRMRESIIADKGVEEADKQMPQYVIDDFKGDLPDDEPTLDVTPATGFSESNHEIDMKPEELAALQAKAAKAEQLEAENATLKTDKEALETKFSAQAEETKKAEITAFCEANLEKLGPEKDVFAAMLGVLFDRKPVAFAAADGTTQDKSLYAEMQRIITALPAKVTLGEVATKGEGFGAGDKKPDGSGATDELRAQHDRVRGE